MKFPAANSGSPTSMPGTRVSSSPILARNCDLASPDVSSCMTILHACDYATGEILSAVPNESIAARFGLPSLAVHRADVHSVLLAAVRGNDPHAVHAAHEFTALEQDADGVSVRFANGVTDRAGVVVGADGNGSAVRSFVLPGEPARFNGQVAFRAVLPDALVPDIVRRRELAMHRGPDRYLLHYPLRGGQLMNLIGCGRTDTWEEEGWSIPATSDQFLDAYADFAPHLLDLIRAVPDGALFKWGLSDRAPLARWTIGRVAMLGDAAHPMTPFLGQGAAMAVEDAVVLARSLTAAGTVPDAFGRYAAARPEAGQQRGALVAGGRARPPGPDHPQQGRGRVRPARLRPGDGAGLSRRRCARA